MTFGWKPDAISAFGSVIDVLMNVASLPFSAWSRSGPILPVAPAGWNVWQPLQPLSAKTFLPAAGFALPAFGSVPMTGPVGSPVFSPPQPATSRTASENRSARALFGEYKEQ